MNSETRKKRILYVEDDQEWTSTVSGYLEDQYEVKIMKDALKALDSVAKNLYDLLIVDISLRLADGGDEQGLTFVRNVRNEEQVKRTAGEQVTQVPIIILTGYPNQQRIKVAFRDFGVSDFVDKGDVSRKVLRKAVEKAIQE